MSIDNKQYTARIKGKKVIKDVINGEKKPLLRDNKGGCFMGSVITLRSISTAKQHFTSIVREALKGHEVLTGNAKSNNPDTVSIIATSDLLYVLDEGFKFHTEVSNDEDGFAIIVNEISIFGYGITLNEAKNDLVENIVEYINDYFAKSEFFKQIPQRKAHYPYLRRLANCSNKEKILEVVFECSNLHSQISQELLQG